MSGSRQIPTTEALRLPDLGQIASIPRWVCTHATLYAWAVSATWREGALRAGDDARHRQQLRLAAVRMYAADRARWQQVAV